MFVSSTNVTPFVDVLLEMFVSSTNAPPFVDVLLEMFVSSTKAPPFVDVQPEMFVSSTKAPPFVDVLPEMSVPSTKEPLFVDVLLEMFVPSTKVPPFVDVLLVDGRRCSRMSCCLNRAVACELPCSTDTENGYTSEGNEYQSGALIFIFLRASMHLTHNGTFIPAGWRPSSRREVSAPSFSKMYCISSGFSIIFNLYHHVPWPYFVAQLLWPYFVAQMLWPYFVAQMLWPYFVAQMLWPHFVAQLLWPQFYTCNFIPKCRSAG